MSRDVGLVKQIEETLSDRGLSVTLVADLDDALRYIRNKSPDLILTDLDLTPHSGFDLCRAVRFTRGVAFTPILLMMDQPSRTDVQKALRLRVNGILVKPFGHDALGKRVIALLKQAQRKKAK